MGLDEAVTMCATHLVVYIFRSICESSILTDIGDFGQCIPEKVIESGVSVVKFRNSVESSGLMDMCEIEKHADLLGVLVY